MGHWSDDLLDEVSGRLGPSVDRKVVVEALAVAGREIDLLSGRTFGGVQTTRTEFEPNGLPMVEVQDVDVGSVECSRGVWAIPDPVNPAHAQVLQLLPNKPPAPRAVPVGEALSIAGDLVVQASRAGRLSGGFILHWLASTFDQQQVKGVFRRLMNPDVHFHVPVVDVAYDGWWFQISRRLLWITDRHPDDGRMVEMLVPTHVDDPTPVLLAAGEPILVVARMTQQPVDWALTARIWPENVNRRTDRTWSSLAKAIHGYGTPTITIDPASTSEEVICQVVLKSYWHGYLHGDEPALAGAIEGAYPRQVERIRKATHSPTSAAAAAMLLEQLVHPGFDPAQGAEATRRYVTRKASIVIMEHRKREEPARYPWTHVGISERRFYKLLPMFAEKVGGRYDYDQEDVVARMSAHLAELDREREIRTAALDLLRSRGFGEAAARKWLQRHPAKEAVDAWPRGSAPSGP